MGRIMFTIRTNVAATQAKRDYRQSTNKITDSFERLSSGVRVTKASDDSAALSVGTNLKAQITSLQQTARNARDGLSLLQTMDGSLSAGQELLSRLRQLTMQVISDGVGDNQRDMIRKDSGQVMNELSRLSEITEFNGSKPLNGSVNAFAFQIGTRGESEDYLNLDGQDMSAGALGLSGFSPTSSADLATVDAALTKLSDMRAQVGAAQNRLMSVLETIGSNTLSLSAGLSRVMDADVATEVATVSNNQVLQQAGSSVISNSYEFSKTALRILEK